MCDNCHESAFSMFTISICDLCKIISPFSASFFISLETTSLEEFNSCAISVNAIPLGYFAVYKRDSSFFSIIRTKSSCTTATNICLFGCTSTCPGQTLSSDHVDARG